MTSFNWDNWIENELPLDARLTQSSMTVDDHRLKAIWNCAFPNGLKHHEWSQLIYLMHVLDGSEYPMSFRAIAHHIGILLNINYVYLLNEVYGVDSIKPDQETLTWLKQQLQACGYYEWLMEDNV